MEFCITREVGALNITVSEGGAGYFIVRGHMLDLTSPTLNWWVLPGLEASICLKCLVWNTQSNGFLTNCIFL